MVWLRIEIKCSQNAVKKKIPIFEIPNEKNFFFKYCNDFVARGFNHGKL